MTHIPLQLYDAMARAHFPTFVARVMETLEPGNPYEPNWHVELIAHNLEQVRAGTVKRLMLNMPPRSMKSIMVSVAFVAWILGHDPARRIMCLTYSKEVAQAQAKLFQRLMAADWMRRIFPELKPKVPSRLLEWESTAGGYRLAASVDGSILSRGADMIILDDPNKGQEIYSKAAREKVKAAYNLTISTRLNHPNENPIICVMQRLHADDLAGHMMTHEDWNVVRVSAVALKRERWNLGHGQFKIRNAGELLQSSRLGRAELETLKRKLGTIAFEAQYQQQPTPEDGIIIKRQWLRYAEEPPEQFDAKIISWDTASTLSEDADYSVGTVWGIGNQEIHLLYVDRVKMEAPDLRHHIEQMHVSWRADRTIIEDADLGRALAQDLRRSSAQCKPLLVKPRIEKLARMQARSVMFETGRIFLPREAPWLADYLDELLGFPNRRYDDQVDSTSQALDWIQQRFQQELSMSGRTRPEGNKRPKGAPRPAGARR